MDALLIRRRKVLDYMERREFDAYRRVVRTLGFRLSVRSGPRYFQLFVSEPLNGEDGGAELRQQQLPEQQQQYPASETPNSQHRIICLRVVNYTTLIGWPNTLPLPQLTLEPTTTPTIYYYRRQPISTIFLLLLFIVLTLGLVVLGREARVDCTGGTMGRVGPPPVSHGLAIILPCPCTWWMMTILTMTMRCLHS